MLQDGSHDCGARLRQERLRAVAGSLRIPDVVLDEAFHHPMPRSLLLKRMGAGDSLLPRENIQGDKLNCRASNTPSADHLQGQNPGRKELESDHTSYASTPFTHRCSSSFSCVRTEENFSSRKLQQRTSDINSLS